MAANRTKVFFDISIGGAPVSMNPSIFLFELSGSFARSRGLLTLIDLDPYSILPSIPLRNHLGCSINDHLGETTGDRLVASSSPSTTTSSLELPRTSRLSAPERRALADRAFPCTSRALRSTVSSLGSWPRVATSLRATAPVVSDSTPIHIEEIHGAGFNYLIINVIKQASPSTAPNSKMRTSASSTPRLASYPWPTPARIPTVRSTSNYR